MKAASLTSLLLARKGDARPAQSLARDAVGPLVAKAPTPGRSGIASIDRPSLERPIASAPVACPPVERAPALGVPVNLSAGRLRIELGGAGHGGSDTVRLSVRLDRSRHRKLRILAAQRGLNLQQALVLAIDGLVATSTLQADGSSCACLREARPRSKPEA
ncbi:MAG: hypothetical protein ACFCVH_02425 [Alphaproteobacteria bacterium]